jgi:tetratricopeptide (TPR) repeat protein
MRTFFKTQAPSLAALTAMKKLFRPGNLFHCSLMLYVLITYPLKCLAADAAESRLPKFHIAALGHAAKIDSLAQQAISLAIAQKYGEALAQADSAIKLAPEEPVGYFFRAAVLHARMLDYETLSDEKSFFSAVGTCRKLAQKKLRQNVKDAWGHFFLGSALGYEAFVLGKKKRYFEAFRTGWQCIQHLEAALKHDPQLYDAYLGIGTYKYYRSKMSKNFTWLPFVDDERAEGIHMIRQAIAKGRYSQTAAINGLCWILMDENRPEAALALVDSALAICPSSRFFLWVAAEAAYRIGHYERAVAHYIQILRSLQNENILSPYLVLVGHMRLARAYRAANKMKEACQELQRLDTLNLSPAERARGEALLKEADAYRKACEEQLAGGRRQDNGANGAKDRTNNK